MTWRHVVNTLPHQAARAESNLLRQGYRLWLPSIRRPRRHARRVETILVQLLPGYLFVELDPEQDAWLPINDTSGVRRLLYPRYRPTPITATFIDSLHRSADDGGVVVMPEPTLRPGQKVQLLVGTFVNHLATLLYLAPKDRVRLLLSLLGQDVSTTVSRWMAPPVA